MYCKRAGRNFVLVMELKTVLSQRLRGLLPAILMKECLEMHLLEIRGW